MARNILTRKWGKEECGCGEKIECSIKQERVDRPAFLERDTRTSSATSSSL